MSTTLPPKRKDPVERNRSEFDIFQKLGYHLWPSREHPNSNAIKSRVVISLGLLFGSKLVNIQVPFLFKDLIDNLSVGSVAASSVGEVLLVGGPLALVVGYGISRSIAAGFNELKNSMFSQVAHGAIRDFSK